MGFNSAFKGLTFDIIVPVARQFFHVYTGLETWHFLNHLPVFMLLQTNQVNYAIPLRCPFLLSGAKRNFHPDVHIRKKLSIKFSRFIGSSVALLYNVPNNST